MNSLVNKYNIPGPRYTSYPTVPYWDEESFAAESYLATVRRSFDESNEREGISLYLHLPFCEQLCTFCACNKRITRKHSVEPVYIDALLKEWQIYLDLFSQKPHIKEIHLGGGTPTFFAPQHLEILLRSILAPCTVAKEPAFSFEGHPNNTTREHLETLHRLGFNRVSYGVQDYDPRVQQAINRMQPFAAVQRATRQAREIGYNSISHDLVFGLPFQTWQNMEDTIHKTMQLKPDRLAFYSYAHVPWIKGNGQRGFDESDLPSPEEKRSLYERGKALLQKLGYHEVGMDHFALPHDELYQSMHNGSMHRNFMGYSASSTQLLIGLGVSSISDSWYGFAQNEKTLEDYYARLENGQLPIFRGHLLNDEDLIIRRHILNLMCLLRTSWREEGTQFEALPETLALLREMEADKLISIHDSGLEVSEAGRPFVRNICMAFDQRMLRDKPQTRIFSMTI